MKDLFEAAEGGRAAPGTPLAERVRPQTLTDFVGQEHLLGEGKPLRMLIDGDQLPSMIFWGPPGTGKTTLARIIAYHTHAEFFQLNAVSSGVKDVREVLSKAAYNRAHARRRTILFIDEIHRFNKAQQDALLHSVEDGLITLIGATTENPSFEVISPLLSRCRVYVLQPLSPEQLEQILDRALRSDEQMARHSPQVQDRDALIHLSGGDARMLLNGLETAVQLAASRQRAGDRIGREQFEEAFQRRYARYDKDGEEHYSVISAFIKSIRGCDPDAAVYWLARMIDAGEDPLFIARRMVILAAEDVGNADPYAITLAASAFEALERIGMPEGRIVLAQAATYLASCPKSNSAYAAITAALQDVQQAPAEGVPLHLRNAPTGLLAHLGYGAGYKYGHSYDGNFVEQQYLPDSLRDRIYYRPTENGRERDIRARLNAWWKSKPR